MPDLRENHADDGNGAVAATDEGVLIEEKLPSNLPFEVFENILILGDVGVRLHGDVFAVVVVAHDGENTIRGFDLSQGMLEGYDLFGGDVDEVAGEDDEVGMLLVDESDELVDEFPVAEVGADMNVGELQDLITVEGMGQQW